MCKYGENRFASFRHKAIRKLTPHNFGRLRVHYLTTYEKPIVPNPRNLSLIDDCIEIHKSITLRVFQNSNAMM